MKNKIIKSTKFVIRATLHPSYGSEQVKLFRDVDLLIRNDMKIILNGLISIKSPMGNLNCKENTPRNLSNVH